MPKFRNYQTNFSGGLLSEGMLGRVDLAQYENGCKQLDNWWPKVTGGMRRRPGSLFRRSVIDAIRLEPFIFNEDQVYAVVFEPSKGLLPKSGNGSLENRIKILDVETGDIIDQINWWKTADEIREMSVTQKGDIMFLAHPNFRTEQLVRTSASTFQLSNFTFETSPAGNGYPQRMPFIKFEAAESTIQPSGFARDTIVNLAIVGAEWTNDNVNSIVRYRGKQILITGLTSSSNAVGVIKEELDQGAVLTFSTSESKPHDFQVDEIIVGRDSGVKAQVVETDDTSISVAMIAGTFAPLTTEEVEGLDSGNIAKILSHSNTNPPASADWDEEAFSTKRGWPGIVEVHSQRLWLGGSSSLPAHIFGSRVAAFFNFDVGDAFPADSIQAALVGKQINQITDIVSGRHLQVFTDRAEFYAPQSEDRPLVPETFDLLPQTRYGSRRTVPPKVFDESTLFVQDHGSAIREFIWHDNQRGYSSDAISLIAEEYLHSISEIEVLYGGYDRPEQLAFFINGDGDIIWYHSARAEQIRTWGRWTTQGSYLSLCVIQDKLYALVERTINGAEVTYFEVFNLDVTVDAAVQLGGQFATSPKSEWPAAHVYLQNTPVDVVASINAVLTEFAPPLHRPDYFLGEYTLNVAGDLDISPIKQDNVTIGLSFTQTLEPMPVEVKDQNGVTTGMPKRFVYVDLYMVSTLAVQLNGQSITTFLAQDDLTARPAVVTGLRKFYLLGYSERPTVLIENRIPLPCEITSLGAEVEY
jgi:hypothetical protein